MSYPSPRTLPAVVSFAALAGFASAQGAAATPPARSGLPPDMLEVPAGKVTMGLEAKQLVELSKSLTQNPNEQARILSTSVTELGETVAEVEAFLLAKFPITNAQYKIFVEKTGHRFPYHWWAEGRKDDFGSKERVQAISEMQTSLDKKIVYWEDNWKDLPWAVPAGTEQHPVTYVSWSDALKYAAWAGMRLPTEAEWMRAASGNQPPKTYLLGDKWDNNWLEPLRLKDARDRRSAKPVGTTSQVSSGPFGHSDFIGNVWEWMFDIGYEVRAPRKVFEKEFDKLRKMQPIEVLAEEKESHRLLKGGSYLSFSTPNQLRLGVRGHAADTETQPSVGFRVAKSMQPARDMARTRIRLEYDDTAIFGNREPLYEDQVGAERYELNDKGIVQGYRAVTVVPISDIGVSDKNPETKGKDLDEISREHPLIVGTFITTEKMSVPALDPGIYTVFYRAKGAAAELVAAVHAGNRELKALKAEEKKAEGKPGAKPEGKKPEDKKADEKKAEEKQDKKLELDWRKTIAKYGVSEAWVADNGAGKLEKIVLKDGNHEIPLDSPLFLFRNNKDTSGSNRFVAHLPAGDGHAVAKSGYKQAKVSKNSDPTGRDVFQFEFGVKNEAGRHLMFAIPFVVDAVPQSSDVWRLPGGAAAAVGAAAPPSNGGGHGNGGGQKMPR